MHRVVTWRNQVVPENLVHIHGRCDRIFPFGHRSAHVVVTDGGNLMVLNRVQELSQLLMVTLQPPPMQG
jgi:hypothetical protein